MRCAWQTFLAMVPPRFQQAVDGYGKQTLQELRLRIGQPPVLKRGDGQLRLKEAVSPEDISFCVNAASHYSPWTASTMGQGYVMCPGGHRLGICGDAVTENGRMRGIRHPTSVCLRVARDFPGIAGQARVHGSTLIIGSPGSGKTTFLRDLIRQRAKRGTVCVVDERGELFPWVQGKSCFDPGEQTDVMLGCGKPAAISALLRTMGPDCIAMDEITEKEDAQALLEAAWSGVEFYATAHAGGKKDLFSRPVYAPLLEKGLFQTLVILSPDKSWHLEEMEVRV